MDKGFMGKSDTINKTSAGGLLYHHNNIPSFGNFTQTFGELTGIENRELESNQIQIGDLNSIFDQNKEKKQQSVLPLKQSRSVYKEFLMVGVSDEDAIEAVLEH